MDTVPKELESINQTLQKLNAIMEQMLDRMPGQAGKFTRMGETAVTVVGILTIVNIVDVILKWFIGG